MSAPDTAPRDFGGRWLTDPRARAAYSEGAGPYRIVPAAVAIPQHADDIAALLLAAREQGWAAIPRGAGSGMPGGNVGDGVVMDLQRLDTPLEVRGDGARVGAAVTWAELDERAATAGLRLPPDPSSGAFCTIGGMVATNAAGARSVRYGSIRRWVRGVEVVTADGERGWLRRGDSADGLAAVTRFEEHAAPAIRQAAALIRDRFPRTRKNSSGYALDAWLKSNDVVDLVTGSEGTLAVVTAVELALAPRPQSAGTILVGLESLRELPDTVTRLLPLDPAAIELLDRTFLGRVSDRAPIALPAVEAVLLVEVESESGQAPDAAVSAVESAVASAAYRRTALDPADRERLWALRHAASPILAELPDDRRSLQIIEDGCVPVKELAEYIAGVRAAAADHGVDIVPFGHAGDGHVHVNALVDVRDRDLEMRLQRLLDAVVELTLSLGGTLTGEHGDGRLRAPFLQRAYGREIVDLFRLVKEAFDPHGVLNPGVIVPDRETRVIGHLKVGRGAAPIDPAVAAGLRDMERTGGWGRSKLDLLGERAP
jgi:FAD/FMN-containing dehydrogenase